MRQLPRVSIDHRTIDLNGGLDTMTPPLRLPPGVCRSAQNYEQDVNGGYGRSMGYERFSGKPAPSDATYATLAVTLTGSVNVGDIVEDTAGVSTSFATVLAVLGTEQLIVSKVNGTWATPGSLFVGASNVGSFSAAPVTNGASTPKLHAQYTNLAADLYRADIAAVPGSGSVLGVWYYAGNAYAFRNNAGGTAVDMYKSTAAGWVLQSFGERVSFSNANASVGEGDTLTQGGVTATIERVVVTTGTLAGGVNTGILVISGRAGGNYAAGAATSTGAGALTLSGAQAAIAFTNPNGRFEFINARFEDAGNEERMYGVDGVNDFFEWDGSIMCPIPTPLGSNYPQHVIHHASRVWLSHGSAIIFSNAGTPFWWDSFAGFAGTLSMGDRVTGMMQHAGGETSTALGVICRNELATIYGNAATDFELVPYRQDAGGYEWSIQRLHDVVMLDDRGFVTMKAAQEYGNFSYATFSDKLQSWVKVHRSLVTSSCVARDKSQYRIFFSDRSALYITMVGSKVVGMMPQYFADAVACCCSREDSSGNEVMLFGGTDGMVYQMERGTSHDGDDIEAFIYLSFAHFGSPNVLKDWREAMLEITGEGYFELSFSYELDYGSTKIAQPPAQTLVAELASSFWDSGSWDSGFWDGRILMPIYADVKGSSANVSYGFRSNSDYFSAIRVSGITTGYTMRRSTRKGN